MTQRNLSVDATPVAGCGRKPVDEPGFVLLARLPSPARCPAQPAAQGHRAARPSPPAQAHRPHIAHEDDD